MGFAHTVENADAFMVVRPVPAATALLFYVGSLKEYNQSGMNSLVQMQTFWTRAATAQKNHAFFVDADFAGHNVGQTLLEKCEAEAMKSGFQLFELMATLTGAWFYARHGYSGNERQTVTLACGTDIDFIPMKKSATV